MVWQGIILEESLEDPEFLKKLKIIKKEVLDDGDEDPWHANFVEIDEDMIDQLKNELKQGWYAHFWQNRKVIAVFKEKKFEFDYDNKDTWKDVLDYGKSLGIPEEQLDFPIGA